MENFFQDDCTIKLPKRWDVSWATDVAHTEYMWPHMKNPYIQKLFYSKFGFCIYYSISIHLITPVLLDLIEC